MSQNKIFNVSSFEKNPVEWRVKGNRNQDGLRIKIIEWIIITSQDHYKKKLNFSDFSLISSGFEIF